MSDTAINWPTAKRVAHFIPVPSYDITADDLVTILTEIGLEDVSVEWFTEPFAYDDAYLIDSVGLRYSWGWDEDFDALYGEKASI